MNNEKQKISPERAERILRIHHWVYSFIIAVVTPTVVIAIDGYRSIWETIFLFGFGGLFAWTIYWTNWLNSVIFAVGLPAIVIAITGYRSVWNIIALFGGCGFIVWLSWSGVWVKKRIYEEFYEDKNKTKF